MPSKTSRIVTIIAILGYVTVSLLLLNHLFQEVVDASVVPLTGLPSWQHIILIAIIWPIIGCILFIPLIPRIIVPLFTRITKRKSDYHHEGYIELEPNVLSIRTVMSRAFFTFLLVMGLESTVIPFFDLQPFLSISEYSEWFGEQLVPLIVI